MKPPTQRRPRRFAALRILAVPMAALLAISVDAGTASASNNVIQTTVNPTAAESSLAGVSCPTAIVCMAVGNHAINGGGLETLAESWNGKTWTALATPSPAGSLQSSLVAVSCASTTSCQAVGDYKPSAGAYALITEGWNGTSWTLESAPSVSATYAVLSGVSCVSSTDCLAVGTQYDSTASANEDFSEAWNGTTWASQTMAYPPSATSSSLAGISCSSSTFCVAVGNTTVSGVEQPLVETYNSGTWSLTSDNAIPGGATSAYLNSASCSGTTCILVGQDTAPTSSNAMSYELQGGSLVLVETPGPIGGSEDAFTSVACVTTTDCYAVGSGETPTAFDLFGEKWNGVSWKVLTIPLPKGDTDNSLQSVSCPVATTCVAVGPQYSIGFVEVMGATHKWVEHADASPTGGAGAFLNNDSCLTASHCEAVGWYITNKQVQVPLAELWNGKKWAEQTVPVPAESTASSLTDVSCTSTKFCEAVGWSQGKDTQVPFAASWKGSGKWVLQTVPLPGGDGGGFLTGVACLTSTDCVGVGAGGSGSAAPIADGFNGAAWSVEPVPEAAGTSYTYLNSVACTSAIACIAVGYGDPGGSPDAIVDTWNGADWSDGTLPGEPGAFSSVANAVTCTSTTACVAVGQTYNGSDEVTLVDVLTASGWTASEPDLAEFSFLEGVSCASAVSCLAVGVDYTDTGITPIAYKYNGANWGDAGPLAPAGAENTTFQSVSCTPGANTCEAVGGAAFYGPDTTLAEQLLLALR